MVTDRVTGRDWEALRRDLALGANVAAEKYGYKNARSAYASLRNHDSSPKQKDSRVSIRQVVERAKSGETPVLPEFIEKQLLSTEMLPIDVLFIDSKYQREADISRQREMAINWEWLACGTIAVNLRKSDGNKNIYYVIDGQQRLGAIKLQGYKEAPCRIYLELTEEQEAMLYELLNRNKKPGYNDLFKSRLSRGEHDASAIRMAVEQSNYFLDPERRKAITTKDSHFYIKSMRELEKIYRDGGVLRIMDTLKLLRDIWSPEPLNEETLILSGTALFVRLYLPSINRTELITKLRRKGLLKVIQMAFQWVSVHGKTNRAAAFCEAMLIVYNENRQAGNRIPSVNY